MPTRYFIDKQGARTTRMQGKPGDGHHDIGQDVLSQAGIVPKDYEDVYRQMFRLKYVRVLEQDDGSVEVEHGAELSPAQQRVVDQFRKDGRQVHQIQARITP